MWEEKSNLHLRELARRSQTEEWDCENEEEEKKVFFEEPENKSSD